MNPDTYTSADFSQLTSYDTVDAYWYGSNATELPLSPSISAESMTPFSYEGVHLPITRWVSDYAGEVTISGVVKRLQAAQDVAAGWPTDGCATRIYLNADSAAQDIVWQQSLAWNDGTAYAYQVAVLVAIGDILDFEVTHIVSRISIRRNSLLI